MRKAAIAFLTFVAAVCLAAFTFAACSNSEDTLELAEFPVPESVTAQYQTVFTLPVVTAKDTEGNEYIATAEVSDASGNKIVLDGYSFFVDSTEDYTAVYRVRAGGKRAEKSMKIVVEGEVSECPYCGAPVQAETEESRTQAALKAAKETPRK